MRVLLVSPRGENDYHDTGAFEKVAKDVLFAPLGLQLLAAMTPSEYEVDIIDENIGQCIPGGVHYDLVGITTMTPQTPRAYRIADELRVRGIKVVMGGYHVSLLPEEALEHCDSVCIGEADLLWPRIVEDARAGRLQSTYQADQLVDLAELPRPRRDLSPKKYRAQNMVQTSRGCPFNCDFCSVVKFFGHRYRFRPVQDVIEEIADLKSQGELKDNMVFFVDDNIVGNKRRAKELFQALIPLKVRWISQCSLDIADDEELLDLAKRSGCLSLLIGFESVAVESLVEMNKKNVKRLSYELNIAKIRQAGILIFGLFIFGFDSDPDSVYEDTLRFIERNGIACATYSVLTPFPGTAFFDRFEAEGRLLHKNWAYYDVAHTVFSPLNGTPEDLQRAFYDTAQRTYAWGSMLKRIMKTGRYAPLALATSLGVKKMYRELPSRVWRAPKAEMHEA